MKKAYVKPALYAERFSIAEHIASCVNVVQFGAECGSYVINGLTLFNNNCGGEGSDNYDFWAANGLTTDEANFDVLKAKGMQCYTTYVNVDTIFTS